MAVTLCPAPTPCLSGRRRRDHRITTADGTSLAVAQWAGPNTAHTAVFLHGLCLNRTAWTTQINYVLRRFGSDTQVISYDHRGHGHSGSAPMSTYRIDQLADDLDHVLTTLTVTGSLTLIGHSLGAMVALTYLAQPARACTAAVDGLVVCASAAGRLSERGISRLLATPALNTLYSVVDRTPARAARALTAPLSTAVGFLPSLRDYDQRRTLPSIQAHTTIISGGADLLTPPAHAEEMAAAIPGATHLHVPDAGHMLPQQAPHCVSAAIRRTIAAAPLSVDPTSGTPVGVGA